VFWVLGQTEDKKPSTDKSWKDGGVFYKECALWQTYLTTTDNVEFAKGRPVSLDSWWAWVNSPGRRKV